MADYQRTIDEIRFFLQSEHCDFSGEMRVLAEALAQGCREANARLRRCAEFLRQGLRSEAIQMAEAEPNLLDLVTLLDFPERPQWDEIAAMYQLPRSEPLLIDVAEQLNEAYAAEAPLQKLLDRQRLLVLSQAPLKPRIEVLRRLCNLDPESTFWDDDVREFEKARLREIDREAREAADRRDAGTLKALIAELGGNDWRVRPPESLLRNIRQRTSTLVRAQARGELERLAGELNDALSSLDRARGQALREEWQQNARLAQLRDGEPLAELAAPALGWLADEDDRETGERDYQKALAALERGLDHDHLSVTELERLGHAVLRFERGIPEMLHTRLYNRISALQIADTRHRQLIIGSSVALVLIAIGLIGLFVYSGIQADRLERLALAVEQLLEEGQLAEARETYDRNRDISNSERWLTLGMTLAEREEAERGRAAEFAAALSGAATASDHAEAQRLLAEAEKLARTVEEKAAHVQRRREIETAHRQAVARLESEITTSIDELTRELAALRQQPDNAAEDARREAQLTEISAKLSELRRNALKAAPKFDAGVELIARQLADQHDLHMRRQQARRILENLTARSQIRSDDPNAGERLTDLAQALQEFAKTLPEDERASEFQAAAAEVELWKGAAEWQRLTRNWRQFTPADAEQAASRIAECESFLAQYGKSPAATAAQTYLNYLRPIQARTVGTDGDEEEGVKYRLHELYSGNLLMDAHVLKAKDGTVYYVARDTEIATGKNVRLAIKYLAGFNGQMKMKTFNVEDLVDTKAAPAPQVKIAREVTRKIYSLGVEEWEEYFHGLTESLLKNTELDPFLRYFLVLRTVEYAALGSEALALELEAPLKLLRAEDIDLTVRWMDPEDPGAAVAKESANAALAAAGDSLLKAWAAARKRTDRIEEQVFERTEIVGWLDRDATGSWVCRSQWKPRSTGTLRVVLPEADGTESHWRTIGVADKNGITLRSVEPAALRQGRVIFATESGTTAVAARGNRIDG